MLELFIHAFLFGAIVAIPAALLYIAILAIYTWWRDR